MGGGGEEVKVLGMYDGNEVTTGVIGMGFPFVWVGRYAYLYIRLDRIYKPLLSACLIIHFREDMVVEAEGYTKLPSCPSYHGGLQVDRVLRGQVNIATTTSNSHPRLDSPPFPKETRRRP